MRSAIGLALSGVFLGAAVGQAQDVDRALVAEAAIAALVRSELGAAFGGKTVKVDLDEIGTSRGAEAVSSRLGFQTSRKADTFRCPPLYRPLTECSLVDVDYLITLREIVVDGDRAVVTVEVQGQVDSDRQPVWSAGWRVTLERLRAAWSVVEVKPAWQT